MLMVGVVQLVGALRAALRKPLRCVWLLYIWLKIGAGRGGARTCVRSVRAFARSEFAARSATELHARWFGLGQDSCMQVT